MALDICSIVLAVSLGSFPDTQTSTLKDSWFNGSISNNNIRPIREELNRNTKNRSPIPKEFLDGTAKSPSGSDCSSQMARAGLKFGPWPTNNDAMGGSVSPDGQPAVQFNPIFLSRNKRYSLITWSNYRGPLDASFHFAILSLEKKKWRVIRDGQFGPVS